MFSTLFNFQRAFKFFIIFFVLTIVGIITHELSHYLFAENLKFKPKFHHSSISFQIKEDLDNPKYLEKELIILIAGPAFTMLTGTFGLLFLLNSKSRKKSIPFNIADWLGLFLSLFWLRQVFNVLNYLLKSIIKGELYFSGDESKISNALNLYPGTVGILTGGLGVFICSHTIFYLLPKFYRNDLILGGFFGSILSFIIWTNFIGKIILP
jgi:hypothetical protein